MFGREIRQPSTIAETLEALAKLDKPQWQQGSSFTFVEEAAMRIAAGFAARQQSLDNTTIIERSIEVAKGIEKELMKIPDTGTK